ncbi:UDP-N-acetylmuramoyl-L-alanine--D-glutamate ligase [Candidatus Kaiserbacteria bacterium CG10_big_fil_rev_8_21_14_0_10_45_20]|uniref:UDP-N-acetylmuramoylalanine--D-glutamate ligase n=1 Tax=Candidatus Kaiserbacteria bacterium CG10_big_fil_rev_8_21_14_0_10_45_20 TaxID=1974607 RepID=A0A2H0UFW8_9BACT|nr:MAG: UDP-N-acetylmuramoyl-L-alanine--D-glutamate ligase [Candidatus Kaiserbacteria bacterium CG10_big_fil_rev_8_21_14_0_10_45_20]
MRNWNEVFEGKKITVMGLGLLGRGVGDAKFLAQHGANIIVTDIKTKEELAESVAILSDLPNVTFRLGGHDREDFKNRDFILKSAGVPLNSPYIAEAQNNNIPIKMSASWFAELAQIPTVGVTGTRGKSTVTHMLYDILTQAKLNVLLGGNVRGVSTLALLPKVEKDSFALLELDSWQCQGFGDAGISPNIAVFTTFMPDHLNYYNGDINRYLDDKAQIFLHQSDSDTLIAGSQVAPLLKEKYKTIRSHVVVTDIKKFPKEIVLKVPGEHNRENALSAIETARALGIDDSVTFSAISSFKGVAGRLEFLGTVRGVSIYNDATSTTPDALRVALHALSQNGRRPTSTILIMGGTDKELSPESFPVQAMQTTKKTILLSGSGTEKIRHLLPDAPVFSSLTEAVEDAFATAEEGDIILFSPAFASFGMFKNEFDRSDQFVRIIKEH